MRFWNDILNHPNYDEFLAGAKHPATPAQHQARGDACRRLLSTQKIALARSTLTRRSSKQIPARATRSSWARGFTAAGRAATAMRSAAFRLVRRRR
jgi:hypothetical protein